MFIAAAIGATIPLLLLALVLVSVSWPLGNYVFGALIPAMGLIVFYPHDPLIWEGIYILIPIFMVSNAVIYGIVGLLIAQIRLWRRDVASVLPPRRPEL